MSALGLDVKKREGSGKGYINSMRKQGYVPSVLYGKEIETLSLMVSEKDLDKIVSNAGESAFLKLTLGEGKGKKEYNVLLRDIQRHPVRKTISHVDFYQVSMSDKLDTTAPIVLVGEPVGVKEGGILQHMIRELEISCLPSDIPSSIEIDISHLQLGEGITVGDVPLDKTFDIISEPDTVIANVVAPQEEEKPEEEDVEGEITAEETTEEETQETE